MKRILAVAVVAIALFSVFSILRGEPRVVYRGGPVLTMDGGRRVVEALGVEGDRIAAVGSEDEVLAWADGRAEIVELEGRALLPGFIDAHGHFPGEGIYVALADLNSPPIGEMRSIDDIVARMRTQSCLLYTSPSPRDVEESRMPSSA